MDSRQLNCLIEGESIVFVLTVGNYVVSDLKEFIQTKRALDSLKDIGPHTLELWKPKDSNPISASPEGDLAERIGLGCLSEFADKLQSWHSVFSIFPTQPPKDYIHIIVKVPRTTTISPSTSLNRRASINTCWCPRLNTVHHLFDILQGNRLVQVRGTPGSGKTTLKHLLHDYIHRQNPGAFVQSISSWITCPGEDIDTVITRVDPAYPSPPVPTYLLFDEAQDTYDDINLWNNFFKCVHDGAFENYYVVLFCRYTRGTPLALNQSDRVSLWHGVNPVGLLLSQAEFEEVVAKYKPSLKLHPDLLDYLFCLTVGHVGALVSLLGIVAYQKCAERRRGDQFTLDDFNEENPIHSLVRAIQGGPFGRGLPRWKMLIGKPGVASFLRTLIRNGEFKIRDVADEAIEYCHRNGWVFSYEDGYTTYYTFPSPLHSVFVSWILEPSDDMPEYHSVLQLCCEAIKMFKPSQLHTPIRRVGQRGHINSLPEAQYQDEFYRSVFSVTKGNVCISPEFASPTGSRVKGRIDFFIPKAKWGIEILRDGDRLLQHDARFHEETGAYGAWLQSGDMTDYVLLDCRTNVPQRRHEDIRNLLHAVFRNDFQEVTLYNNQLEKVGETFALVENHL